MRPVGDRLRCTAAAAALVAVAAAPAVAATYRVGPGEPYRQLNDLPALAPGDEVEVVGGATYAGDVVFDDPGAPDRPIVVRGVRVDGRPPVIAGGDTTVEFRANHYVFEGFAVTGGSRRCVFHHAHDITIRDSVVYDCPGHGILGADDDSGSLTLSYVEVHDCGDGERHHQIYMATDEDAYPGAVFRMEHCYVHDGRGGNNVKSRAERNEIYYNWIEGAAYHEVELIGPDGASESLAREDSEVACNVIRKTGPNAAFYAVRVGGDGTGQTWGRYRFVNNTFVLAGDARAAVRVFDGIDSLELHNNAFVRAGGGGVRVCDMSSAAWAQGERAYGRTNWLPDEATGVPQGLVDSRRGADPRLEDVAGGDLRPADGSPLIDAGTDMPPTGDAAPFPRPLDACAYLPPPRRLEAVGAAVRRPRAGAIDIGAYEFGAERPGAVDAGPDGAGGGGGAGTTTDGGAGSGAPVGGGCGCRAGAADGPGAWWPGALAVGLRRRRRRRSR
ncbi:MAG: hypothetical protein D6689_20090 [Deltaproteobacteria bacterium]|nr:MAG: hypothetical protein D6689_20090 [Deltaproteobacteria bacterium]